MVQIHYYEKTIPNMGYRPPPVTDVSYTVTVSNDTMLIGGDSLADIDFIPGKSYIFRQNDTSNLNKILAFTQLSDPDSLFTKNMTVVGEPGQPDSYITFSVPDTSNAITDLVFDYIDTSGISTTVSGDSYVPPTFNVRFPVYNDISSLFMTSGDDLSFSFTNHSGEDVSYSIVGTFDLSGVISRTGTLSDGADASFNQTLSSHGGIILYINNKLYFRKYVPYKKYVVTVSNGVFYFNGVTNPLIYAHINGNYLFDQTDPSNEGHRLLFSYTENEPVEYTATVSKEGTVGTFTGFTLLQVPDVSNSLYYYSDTSGAIQGNQFLMVEVLGSHKLSVENNYFGDSVYAVYDETDQEYHKQEDLDISSGVYYFDTSHESNRTEPLAFGVNPNNLANTADSITHYSFDISQGYVGSYVYLDTRNYTYPADTVFDICFNGLPKAYSELPFTVSITNNIQTPVTYTISGDVSDLTRSPSNYTLDRWSINTISCTFGSISPSDTYVVSVGDISASFEYQQVNWARKTVTVINERLAIDGVIDATLDLTSGYVIFDISSIGDYTFQLAENYDGAGGEYTTNIFKTDNYYYVFDAPLVQLYYYDPNNSNRGNVPYDATERSVSISTSVGDIRNTGSDTSSRRKIQGYNHGSFKFSSYGYDYCEYEVDVQYKDGGYTDNLGLWVLQDTGNSEPPTATFTVFSNNTWVDAGSSNRTTYEGNGAYYFGPVFGSKARMRFTTGIMKFEGLYAISNSVSISSGNTFTLYRGLKYKFNTNDSTNAGRTLKIGNNGSEYNDTNVIYSTGTAGSSGSYSTFIVPYDAVSRIYLYSDTTLASGTISINDVP